MQARGLPTIMDAPLDPACAVRAAGERRAVHVWLDEDIWHTLRCTPVACCMMRAAWMQIGMALPEESAPAKKAGAKPAKK
jgi:hypothetical protein